MKKVYLHDLYPDSPQENENITLNEALAELYVTFQREQWAEERRDRRHLSRHAYEEEITDALIETNPDPCYEFAEAHNISEWLHKTMERLPKDERELLHFRFVKNYTLQAIADVVGCSTSSADRRIKRALQRLRKMIE